MKKLTGGVASLVALLLLSYAAGADPKNDVYQIGISFCEKGNYDAAIAIYTEAIRRNPKDARAYFLRGTAYGGRGDRTRGTVTSQNWRNAEGDDDGTTTDYTLVPHNRCFQQGDDDKAMADYTEAIRPRPQIRQAIQ